MPEVKPRVDAKLAFWQARVAELRGAGEEPSERRNLAARRAREWLAERLNVHPRDLSDVSPQDAIDLAERMSQESEGSG